MGDGPAQARDRGFGIHPLQHVEQVMDRTVVVPVEGRGHASRDRPAQRVEELLLVLSDGLSLLYMPQVTFSPMPLKAQPVVAEAHGQELRQLLEVLALVVPARSAQAVANPHR